MTEVTIWSNVSLTSIAILGNNNLIEIKDHEKVMFLLMIYLPHTLQVLYCENISINGQILEQGLAAAPALACAWRGLARLCEDEISGLFVGCRLPGEAILARHRSLCWPEGRFGYGDCNKSSLVVGSTKAQYGSKSLVCTHFSQRTTSAHSLAHCCAIFLGHWVLIFAKKSPGFLQKWAGCSGCKKVPISGLGPDRDQCPK